MKTTPDNDTSLKDAPENSAATSESQPDNHAPQILGEPSVSTPHAGGNFGSDENDSRFRLDFGELIYSYTRAQAIADGVLVDVSSLAKEAGFRHPVAMTEAAWETCVRVPDGVDGQDETGRLWDVLNVLLHSIILAPDPRNEVHFTVAIRQASELTVNVDLKALCHPGDQAEPVITILLPHED